MPSPYVRATARAAAPFVAEDQIIVDVAKGMEAETLMTLTGVIGEEMAKLGRAPRLVALSGPTHAEEVARDLPTTIVSASPDAQAAARIQDIFMTESLRVYTNADIRGVEVAGALKNVIALAAGIAGGLGYGDNARAAIITRGIAEMARLGAAMGCSKETFSGLTGLGDLVVTCTSMHSRNNRCGMLIGQGKAPDEAVREVGMVVEGLNAPARGPEAGKEVRRGTAHHRGRTPNRRPRRLAARHGRGTDAPRAQAGKLDVMGGKIHGGCGHRPLRGL